MIKPAIKYRKIIFYLLFLILCSGIYSFLTIPKQEAPDLSPPVCLITAIYPGASQEDVETFVTAKIEQRLMDMEEYDYSYSYSYNSAASIVVYMKYGIDTSRTWTELRRQMNDLTDELPKEVKSLDINTDLTQTAGIIISLTGEGYDYDMLSFYGDKIIGSLQDLEGVAKFETMGEASKEVEIQVNSGEMNRLNLSYQELSSILDAQNLEIPSGMIETDEGKIPLHISGSFESLKDIENIILDVSTDNYSVLKLKDIASIQMKENTDSTIFQRDGQKAILLVGYFENNKNVLEIGKEVRKTINEIKEELPNDLHFEEVIYQPEEVDKAINGFMKNLIMGVILVILVVFIGMGFRNAIIVSFAIPSSILSTILLMPILGLKIHSISITAFIVALGMLVDNAIVVSDSIQIKLDEGMEKMEACVNGTKEVIISILTSTLTTIAAFSPLLLLNSVAGDYVKSLPQVVIIALISSFVFAFLVTPCLAFVFFKVRDKEKKKRQKTIMQWLLEVGMRRKFLAFLVGISILALLGSSFLMLNVIFFPKADKQIIYMDIVAEKNIDTTYTKTITDQIENFIKDEAGIIHYTTAIGGGIPKYYDTLGINAAIPEKAQIVMEVDLNQTRFSKNTEFVKDLQDKIDKILVGGRATIKELEYADPISSPIYVRVLGDNTESLTEASQELESLLKSVEGAQNIKTDYDPYVYEYEIDLSDPILSHYGLMKYDVLNEVSIALRGRDIGTYRNQGEEYSINLDSDTESIQDIENLMIKASSTGNKHLLKDLGQVKLVKTQPVIRKYNGEASIILQSDLQSGYDSGTVEGAFKEKIKTIHLENVELLFDGENAKIGTYFGNLGIAAIFAVFLILTILLFQFKNFKQALIILLSLPLSAAGAIFGLFLMKQPISFTGMLGIISLIGIVVNNAIVLMEYINLKRSEGMSVDEAAVKASVVRFRPIILSTITTVIGLLPLMFSNSELFKPMSVTLIFGLLVSTFLTLVFIPLTYSLVFHKDNHS